MLKGLPCLGCLALLTILVGCGGGSPNDLPSLVPASGVATLDGTHLPGAEITFHAIGKANGPSPLAYTDKDGKFTVRTSDHDGATVGDYKVTIIKNAKEDGSELTEEEKADPALAIVSNILAEQYADVEKTPLKATIGEGGNESITLELVSEPAS